MKTWLYFTGSSLFLLGTIIYAWQREEQFYPTIVYLVSSKVSLVAAGNFVCAITLCVGQLLKKLFLGTLRSVEYELLCENSKYAITETCLALSIFRHELSPPILGFFGLLLFIKAFHWLAKSRLEYFEQIEFVSTIKHLRLYTLMCTLLVVDSILTYYCVDYTITHGKSVLILFGFEFCVLVISVVNIIFRYSLRLIELLREEELANKDLLTMSSDLLADVFKLIIYAYFFGLVFIYYGLPIHIIREFWMSYVVFRGRLSTFVKFMQLTQNLGKRFPDATEEEITEAADCIICKQTMIAGRDCKRLPCGHILHLMCLRRWLQYQQSCPLCRAEIPTRPSPTEDQRAAVDAANRAREAQANANINVNGNDVTGGSGVGLDDVPLCVEIKTSKDSNRKGKAEFPAFFLTLPDTASQNSESNSSSDSSGIGGKKGDGIDNEVKKEENDTEVEACLGPPVYASCTDPNVVVRRLSVNSLVFGLERVICTQSLSNSTTTTSEEDKRTDGDEENETKGDKEEKKVNTWIRIPDGFVESHLLARYELPDGDEGEVTADMIPEDLRHMVPTAIGVTSSSPPSSGTAATTASTAAAGSSSISSSSSSVQGEKRKLSGRTAIKSISTSTKKSNVRDSSEDVAQIRLQRQLRYSNTPPSGTTNSNKNTLSNTNLGSNYTSILSNSSLIGRDGSRSPSTSFDYRTMIGTPASDGSPTAPHASLTPTSTGTDTANQEIFRERLEKLEHSGERIESKLNTVMSLLSDLKINMNKLNESATDPLGLSMSMDGTERSGVNVFDDHEILGNSNSNNNSYDDESNI